MGTGCNPPPDSRQIHSERSRWRREVGCIDSVSLADADIIQPAVEVGLSAKAGGHVQSRPMPDSWCWLALQILRGSQNWREFQARMRE